MARAGGGQQYYGQTADDLYDSFDSELQLLESLYARQVRLKLVPAAGVIVEALSQRGAEQDGAFILNDLAYGAEVWLLARLHVGPCGDAERALLAVTATAMGVDGTPIEAVSPLLQLPAVDAAALAALPADELVSRRIAEVRMANAAEQVREHLMHGRPQAAQAVLKSLEALVEGHPWLQDKLDQLRQLTQEDRFMAQKELAYTVRHLQSRMVSKLETPFEADETMRTDIPAYLRKKSSEGRGRRRQ